MRCCCAWPCPARHTTAQRSESIDATAHRKHGCMHAHVRQGGWGRTGVLLLVMCVKSSKLVAVMVACGKGLATNG